MIIRGCLFSVLLSLPFAPFLLAQTSSSACGIVSVYDSQEGQITGIVPADFEAKVQGKSVKVASIEPDRRPHRFVLIVDARPMMLGAGKSLRRWKFTLAGHFFAENRQRAQFALVIFSSHTNVVVDFAQGNAAVEDLLQKASKGLDPPTKDPDKETDLEDAVLRGLNLLDQPTSADAIYVVAEALDFKSPHDVREVVRRLADAEVRLFAMLFYPEPGFVNNPNFVVMPAEELSEIARKSGGAILSKAELHDDRLVLTAKIDGNVTNEETLTHLYQAITKTSVLEVELPFAVDKSDKFELKLSDAAQRRWKGAHTIYSHQLSSCASRTAS